MGGSVNYKIILNVLSRSLLIITLSFVVCMGVALIYGEGIMPFLMASLITLGTGGFFILISRNQNRSHSIERKEAYLTVTLTWLIMGLAGCLPFLFSGAIPRFVDAFFESFSGFTTTGSSILTDIEALPKSILFWRSLTHWIGGIGIIVLVIVVMPSLRIGSYNLFTLESSLQERIQFRIAAAGKRILLIYVILTFTEIFFLMLGKMSLFESICHAFGTVATGGFSPKNDSLAGYSPYIQYVVMVFMLLAGTNFVIHYYLFKRDFQKIKENEELRFYGAIILLTGAIVTATLFFSMNKTLEESFRESFFQVISIITCTGFATADYEIWPVFAWGLLFFCMFLGGSTGSTAGGIKMARHLLLLKNIRHIVRKMISPNAILPVRLNNKTVSSENNASILTFISIYFLIYIFGTIMLVFNGLDAQTASSAAATCMAGIGPGLGTVGPAENFAHLPDISKIVLSLLMLMGRLEIYTVILLFSGKFWKA